MSIKNIIWTQTNLHGPKIEADVQIFQKNAHNMMSLKKSRMIICYKSIHKTRVLLKTIKAIGTLIMNQ